MRIVDVLYSDELDVNSYERLFEKHAATSGHHPFLAEYVDLHIIRHLNGEGKLQSGKVNYHFFKGNNSRFWIPWRLHLYLKKLQPDVIIVQGLVFPLKVIFLRLVVGTKCKIIVVHHAERPMKHIKILFQQVADWCIDTYLFTSKDNAKEWVNKKVISDQNKIFEVLEGSTRMQSLDKAECKHRTGMTGTSNFLWVGRLAIEKDPMTVLKGFEHFLQNQPDTKLYMIYQEANLLAEVTEFINGSEDLTKNVKLIGKIDHDELAVWYSAADYFISGSHREGSGYALIEALKCGCVPVVTNIPSFKKITGGFGVLFAPGNSDGLYTALCATRELPAAELSQEIVAYANNELSFKTIADDIYSACSKLTGK